MEEHLKTSFKREVGICVSILFLQQFLQVVLVTSRAVGVKIVLIEAIADFNSSLLSTVFTSVFII